VKVGLGISRTNVDSQWNPVYSTFHRFTKQFVGSTVNVTLTRQTYGQRSSRTAERKRRALQNIFLRANYQMFPTSKCREHSYLGRCTCFVPPKGQPLCNAKFRFFLRAKHVFFRKSPLCSGSLFASTSKVYRPRSESPLHF